VSGRLRVVATKTEVGTDAIRALAVALLPYLRELGALEQRDGELADVAGVVPLPRRVVYAACRSGAIAGASRVARRWLATRSAIDAWLRARGPRLVQAEHDDDELEATRRRLTSPARRRRSA
jgi:hypothetical protein